MIEVYRTGNEYKKIRVFVVEFACQYSILSQNYGQLCSTSVNFEIKFVNGQQESARLTLLRSVGFGFGIYVYRT